MCLLHVLCSLRESLDVGLHVAHLNHGTRGDASDADARFVRTVAEAWNLPATIETRDVPALADEYGLAFEEAARRVRYAFLGRVAQQVHADRIAVGHNADDQAETVLMHILRGSGLSGLRGMLPLTPLRDYRLLPPFVESQEPDEARQAEGQHTVAPQGLPERRAETSGAPSSTTLIRPLLRVSRRAVEDYCAEHGIARESA